jgi:DNA-directed RNA polymerase subunit E'/Rpb7
MNRIIKTRLEKNHDVYVQSVLNSKIFLDITEIGKNLKQTLEDRLISKISNRCIPEGYVSPKNIKIIQYSSGTLVRNSIVYHVVYECNIAHPVEGMLISAKTKTITKAGIHAQVIDTDGNIPIIVFVARDHNITNSIFHDVKEDQVITVKVIGIRYELNDPYVCVIANVFSISEPKKRELIRADINELINTEYDKDFMNTNAEDNNCLSEPVV